MLIHLRKSKFSSSALNLVQSMKSYQKALEFAHNQSYTESIGKLKDTLKELDGNIGPNTNLHLYINQRIASLYKIQKDLDGVEHTF